MKKVWLFGFFHALVISAWGQFALHGTVKSTDGNPLAGASIVVEQTFQGTSAGTDGSFTIQKLKPGTVSLRVSFLGYAPAIKEVTIPYEGELSFVLEPSPVLADEVVVRATRMAGKTPSAVTLISREEIQQNNLGQDIPFLLSLTPSLVPTSDAGNGIGYTNFRIRGSDAYRMNVTVNGIPLNDAESQGVWWIDLPDIAASTENIYIQRGVGSSTNGAGAFGATISLQTNTLRPDPYTTIDLGGGSYNTRRTTMSLGSGLINRHFTFDARLSRIHSDGYIDRALSNLNSWFVSGAWYGQGQIIRLNVFSGNERTYQAWYGVEKSILDTNRRYNPYTYDNETDNYRQTHYQLIWSKEFSRNFYLNAALHYTAGKGYYEQYKKHRYLPDYGMNPITASDTVFEISDLIQQKWMDNDFYGGILSFHYRTGKFEVITGGGINNYLGNHFGKVIWAQYAGENPIRHEWYRNKGDKIDYNTYVKINYQLNSSLTLFTDLQFRGVAYRLSGIDDYRDNNGLPVDIKQSHDYRFINPKVGISWTISPGQDFYFTFSTGQREPTRQNYLDATPSSIKPKPERLFDYETGVNISGSKWKTNINLFYMDYRNQLVYTGKLNDVAYPIMTNVPSSYRAGVEIEAAVRPATGITWKGNLTLSRNKIRNFTEYADYYDTDYNYLGNNPKDLGETDISYSPSITGASNLEFLFLKNASATFTNRYVGSQYFDNTSSRERMIDPYFVSDLRLAYNLHPRSLKNVALQFQIINLFNELYESNAYGGKWYVDGREQTWAYYFPQAERHFLIGIRSEF